MIDDDHQSMVVNNADEYEKVVSVSWLPASGEWSAEELPRYVVSALSCHAFSVS